jgi:hypothetical protein
MKELNRRDYLKHMGIAAAGTIAGLEGLTPTLQGSNRDVQIDSAILPAQTLPCNPNPQPAAVHWPWTSDEPRKDNLGVRLIFMGMMVFTYKDREGRVVFHRGDAHNLRIVVLENVGGICTEIFSIGGGIKPLDIKEMEIRTKGKSSDIAYFQHTDPFDRANDKGHKKDFRWLLDLEAPPFNPGKVTRKKEAKKFFTKLNVMNGTFYTYQITNSRFKTDVGPCKELKLGHVAMVMAADIPLSGNQCVSFVIDGREALEPLCRSDALYEVYFLNGCRKGQCPDHGDFDMAFDAVDNPSNRFKLTLDGAPGKTVYPSGLCTGSPDPPSPEKILKPSLSNFVEIFLNDEAPCMGPGLGQGGGFP